MIVRLKQLRDHAVVPRYQTSGASGADLVAVCFRDVIGLGGLLGEERARTVLEPGERALALCGFSIEIPHGYEGQVRPRSGLARDLGITVANTPGTIDSDYRGELGALLVNVGTDDVELVAGQRVAQLVIAPVEQAEIVLVDELSLTARGVGGWGHTAGYNRVDMCGRAVA